MDGASVTEMTWDGEGNDAVLAAGGEVWHLCLPRGGDFGVDFESRDGGFGLRGGPGAPALARIWPEGKMKT